MEEIKNLSAEEISELLLNAGVKAATIEGLNFQRSEVPLKGIFASVGTVTAEIQGKDRTWAVINIIDKDKKHVGKVAFSRLFAGECVPLDKNDPSKGVKTFQIKKKDSAHMDKFMPTTARLNNLTEYGGSDTQIISNLLGKSYTAKVKEDCIVPDLNDLNHIRETEEEASQAVTTKSLHLFKVTS